jgi:hypothetical protein
MKTRLTTLLLVALSVASVFAKAKWGYGFFQG